MNTFRKHLNEKLKNDQFRRLYEEERQLAELSLKIFGTRESKGLSQKEVAKKQKSPSSNYPKQRKQCLPKRTSM